MSTNQLSLPGISLKPADIVLPQRATASGADCLYFNLDDIGYKFFYHESVRDTVLRAQYHAYLAGLGPKPYECLTTTLWSDAQVWGYRTEIADVGLDNSRRDVLQREARTVYHFPEERSLCDFSGCNLGTLDDDEVPVILDFGYQTFGFRGYEAWDIHLQEYCNFAYTTVDKGEYY